MDGATTVAQVLPERTAADIRMLSPAVPMRGGRNAS